MENRVKAAEIAFWANKAYYDACLALKGTGDTIKETDWDSYSYFELRSVPVDVDFMSSSKMYQSDRVRKNEFRKYLYFFRPKGLDVREAKRAEYEGLKAACEVLSGYGVQCRVRVHYRD